MGCGSSAKSKYAEGDGKPAEAAADSKAATPADAKPADAKPADAAPKAAAAPADAAPKAAAAPPDAKAAEAKPAAETKPAEAPAAEAKAEEPKKAAVGFAEPEPDEDEEDDEYDAEAEAAFEAAVMRRTEVDATGGGGPRKTRCAVSAETTARDADWKAPVYEKTAEQETRLTKALGKSFMFQALSSEDLPVVIKAFKENPVAAGTAVIKQGDEVTSDEGALFVFESGKCAVYKRDKDKEYGAEAYGDEVFQYTEAGNVFGELALLYNAPRAATVVAVEDSKLWSIDRNTFNYMVKDAARTANEKRKSFIEEVPILKKLTPEEKATLADCMNVKLVMKDELVIKQGDVGKEFFILEAGSLEARKDGNKLVGYGPKDYFGELALLRDAPRACDVVATADVCKVLSLDQGSFHRIVSSLEQILKENAASYEGVEMPK